MMRAFWLVLLPICAAIVIACAMSAPRDCVGGDKGTPVTCRGH